MEEEEVVKSEIDDDGINHLLLFLFHQLILHEHIFEDDHQLKDHFDENLNNFHREILQKKKIIKKN